MVNFIDRLYLQSRRINFVNCNTVSFKMYFNPSEKYNHHLIHNYLNKASKDHLENNLPLLPRRKYYELYHDFPYEPKPGQSYPEWKLDVTCIIPYQNSFFFLGSSGIFRNSTHSLASHLNHCKPTLIKLWLKSTTLLNRHQNNCKKHPFSYLFLTYILILFEIYWYLT